MKISSAVAIASVTLAFSGCKVDELYTAENITNVDKTVTVFENGLSIPLVNSTAKLRVDSLLKKAGVDTTAFGDYIIIDESGNYHLNIAGTYSLDQVIKDLKLADIVKIDAIDFDQEFSYEIGDIDASSMKIDAQEFGSEMTLDDFSSAIDGMSLSPITETYEVKAGLSSVGNYSLDYSLNPIERNQALLSQSDITSAAAAASLLGQSEVSFPPVTIPVDLASQTVPALTMPENVTAINSVTLKSGAKIRVTLSVSNCILEAGMLTPDINIDLSDILNISGIVGPLNLSDLALTKENNYSATKEYVISSLLTSKLFSEKLVSMSGNIYISGAKATVASANSISGALGINVNVEFVNFGVESIVGTISEVSMDLEETLPIEISDITLPEQVKSVSEVSFTETSGVNLVISSLNLSKISGLNAQLQSLVIEFPSAFQISGEGVSGNKLTLSNINLASNTSKTIKLEKINLPAPVGGKIGFSGNVKVSGKVVANGTINTAQLPKTDADDVAFKTEINAQANLADFKALINPIEQDVTVEENEFSMELPDAVGDFGTFTITPKGSPVLKVTMGIPDLGSVKITSAQGVKVMLPSIVKFGTIPSELNYNAAESSITIKEIKNAVYDLPIEAIVATPVKKDGKYVVSAKYSASGKVGIAECEVNKSVLDNVSGATIVFKAEIPELQASTIAVDELKYDVDQKFEFEIMKAADIPEMLSKVEEIKLTDVDATLAIDIDGLPSIGGGKFMVDVTANLPEFINPSTVELKGEVSSDGKFSKTVRINGFDLSSYDFAKIRADEDALAGEITVAGKVYATKPAVSLDDLSGKINGKISAKISDENGKIGVRSISAKVDFQIDTTMKVPFIKLPAELKDCKFDLPDVTLNADIRSNLAIPAAANAVVNKGTYKLDLNFPYSAQPKDTLVAHNSFVLDFDPILNDAPDSIAFDVHLAVDKTRSCYIEPAAKYVLGINYEIDCPVQLGEHFEIVYADTIALGDAGATLQQVLEFSNATITAKADNGLPLSATIIAEFLSYDENTDTYTVVDGIEEVKSDLLKARSQSDLRLEIKAKKGADISGMSHVRLYAKLSANGETLHPEDYIQLSDLAVEVPDGVTVDIDTFIEK